MKKALVCGAGGFIGAHLVTRLKSEGFWVRGVDLELPKYGPSDADEFLIADLRRADQVEKAIDQPFDEIYQLAADMGGAGYIFTGDNDADVMHNSASINLNVVDRCRVIGVGAIFYSSSACIYPEENQMDPENPNCAEGSAYPANPDSEYGWEKLFSERLYEAYRRNYGLNSHMARYHNIFGTHGTWKGGKEKAPAALCRKVAEAPTGGSIEIWGDGLQTRSFLFVDDCIEGTLRLNRSDISEPLNIGSEEMISINDLARMIIDVSGKHLEIRNIAGPTGVRGRNSDNSLIRERLGWSPQSKLRDGIEKTYHWISSQL